jgi:plasmid stability protein
MTKPGYKQIMVPDDLHSVLKGQASTRKTSMAKLIRSLLAQPVEPASERDDAHAGAPEGRDLRAERGARE